MIKKFENFDNNSKMKKETKRLLWDSIDGLFYSWGGDTPPEVMWNVPTLVKALNVQFGLNLPTEVLDESQSYEYHEQLKNAFDAIETED